MTEEKILNKGLELALEFGSNWMQPIQSRLHKKFPELKTEDLDRYNAICGAAMTKGHDYVYKRLESVAREKKTIKQKELAEELRSFLHRDYPWIDENNLKSIFSQGCYYAWKDGLDRAIEG